MKKRFLTISLALVWITLAPFSGFAQDAPPKEEKKREANLVELNELDKTLKLDIRYARADNFVGRAVYTEARAFMQRPAAEAVVRVHKKLKKKGFRLGDFRRLPSVVGNENFLGCNAGRQTKICG